MDIDLTKKFVPREYQVEIFRAFADGFKKILVILPRRCLSGDSHILMSNGSYKLLKDIEIDDKILSWDGSKFVIDKIVNKWMTGVKETVTVHSPGYLPLVSSPDHKFATTWACNETLHWKRASEVNKQIRLLNYAGLTLGTVSNPDLAEFYGYMLADGYVSHYQQPKFTNINLDILQRVQELGEKLFDCKIIRREKGNGFDLGFSNGTLGGGSTPNQIKELFRKDGLDVPKSKKRLPSFIWGLDEYSLGRYFAGLISADGNIYCHKRGFVDKKSGRSIPPSIEVSIHCGLSYELAWDIYWLLRKMGILPQNPVNEKGSNWKIRVSKSVDVRKLLSYGPIYGKQEKQQEALDRTQDAMKKNSIWRGCYRTKFKKLQSNPEELFDIETEKNHNFVANGYVVHNSGKDISIWNLAIAQCLKKICLVTYCLPTFTGARRIIWDAIAIDGTKFIDYCDPKLVASINNQQMKVTFINGSILQLVGAEDVDRSLIGTNPYLIIFSEFGLMKTGAQAFSLARPIVAANGGAIIICSTPRGKNALYHLYQQALTLSDWKVIKRGTTGENGTNHISAEVLATEKSQMDPGLYEQEFQCSFEKGIEGSIYGRALDQMHLDNRITYVPYMPDATTYVAMDIGFNDATALIWYQVVDQGNQVRIIDCYSNNFLGLDHYVKIIKDKPYTYDNANSFWAPHDLAVHEWGNNGIPRLKMAADLGVDFNIIPLKGFDGKTGLQEGINVVWANFGKFWIDSKKCKSLISSLENYRREWDEEKQTYGDKPVKNFAVHFCDSVRYMSLTLNALKKGMSLEDFEAKKARALYGNRPNMFNNPLGR